MSDIAELAKHLKGFIEAGWNVSINYQGKPRELTPYLLGQTKDNRIVLHGFQYGGESSKGPVASPEQGGWRFFYLDQIDGLWAGPGPQFPETLVKSEGDYKPPAFIVMVMANRKV